MEESVNPKISVIVPVYNVEKYLHKCIDSILAQTFTDFELLLINDGSKDNSGKICDEYGEKDKRIRVFHKENGGVSSARNMGLDNARGEWIAFVDSDDWVERGYLEMFFTNITPEKTMLIIQNIFHETDKGQTLKCNFNNSLINKDKISDLFSKNEIVRYGYPFCKLFNASVLNMHQIRFDLKISYSEDLLFFLTYLEYVNSVYLIENALYHYVFIDELTLSKKYFSFESEFLLFSQCQNLINRLSGLFRFDERACLICNQHLGMFYSRCLTSIFRKENNYAKEVRLALLERVNNLSFDPFFLKVEIYTPFIPGVFFLKKKYYKLCNSYFGWLFNLRYALNYVWVNRRLFLVSPFKLLQ